MALTVRPDDEVYQFDTVWLGPDEYTLPIQARYVAWGTWLACFLVAAVVLIPLGGNGPAGVLGSVIWSLGLSVVLSRAVMLVVDHERPLRSLPALFSAEARAALAARRRAERSLLVRPGKIRVRETPPKVLAMRERERARAAAKAGRKRQKAPRAEVAVVEPVVEPDEPAWTPDLPADEWSEPAPAWSVPTDDREDYPVAPVPAWSIPAGEHERYVATPAPATADDDEVHEYVRAPDPEPQHTRPAAEPVPVAARPAAPVPAAPVPAAPVPAAAGTPVQGWTGTDAWPTLQARAAAHARTEAQGQTHAHPAARTDAHAHAELPPQHPARPRPAAPAQPAGHPAPGQQAASGPVEPAPIGTGNSPFRGDPREPEPQPDPYRGPVTVSPDGGRHAKPDQADRSDPHAALEARIMLPARKDR